MSQLDSCFQDLHDTYSDCDQFHEMYIFPQALTKKTIESPEVQISIRVNGIHGGFEDKIDYLL